MNPLTSAILSLLEALVASVGPAVLDDLEAWLNGKRAPAPTLAQEQKTLEGAADVEAARVLK